VGNQAALTVEPVPGVRLVNFFWDLHFDSDLESVDDYSPCPLYHLWVTVRNAGDTIRALHP